MTFTISQAAALARRENRASQAEIDWSSAEVRQNGIDLLRELVTKVRSGELRYIGQGSQGDETAAFQYALMAATGGQQRITIDGIFGSRSSHQSTDLLAQVQNAVGERSTKYQGTGPEAAGINTFVAIHNRLAAADASPLQIGIAPPTVAPGQRQRERTERLAAYDELVAAGPAAEPPADRVDPAAAAPTAAVPGPITDEATARAAIVAVEDPTNPARADVLKRVGIAARAPAEGVDNAAVIRGAVAQLMEGTAGDASRRIADFLGANTGQDNTAILTALRATPQWTALRSNAASPTFDGTGVSVETWNALAGPRPAANASEADQQTWRMLRFNAARVLVENRQPLGRDDLYIVARMAKPEHMGVLTTGAPADAIAAVRQRVDELAPAEAAQLLTAIHGPVDAQDSEEVRARRAIAYGVAHDVFDRDGVTDEARFKFFTALAAANSPTLVTMPPREYAPMMERINSTATFWWFGMGSRYIGDLTPSLDERRRAIHGDTSPPRPYLRGGGYLPLG